MSEYISVAAVTAAYGSALTAGHFLKSAKSNQKRSAPDQKQKRGGLRADRFLEAGLGPNVGAGLSDRRIVAIQAPRYNRHIWLMPSQASQLPQKSTSNSALALALALFLILILILGAPPNPCRITGTPSLGEVPSVGARALCLLWGFSKVSRRKGGTLSGRYLKNGYVLNKTNRTQTWPNSCSTS